MEIYKGSRGAYGGIINYYVFPFTKKQSEIEAYIREVCRASKRPRDNFTVITVWIDEDGLYLKAVEGAEKMIAIKRK